MTEVEIKAGACGFVTRVRAEKEGRRQVNLVIESDCQAVDDLAGRLTTLDFNDLLRQKFSKGPICQTASETLSHAACPVLSGIFKCAEVELGLAVPRDVTISFLDSKD